MSRTGYCRVQPGPWWHFLPMSLKLESETSISAVTPFSDDQAVAYREYVMMSKEGGTVSENSRETNNHIQKQVGMGENLGLQSLSK